MTTLAFTAEQRSLADRLDAAHLRFVAFYTDRARSTAERATLDSVWRGEFALAAEHLERGGLATPYTALDRVLRTWG